MMREEKRAATPAARDPREEFVTSRPPRRFDGLLAPCGQRFHIRAANLDFEFVRLRELANERRVGAARFAAQFVIEMTDDELLVTAREEPMQKRHGIATAGDADQAAPRRWKSGQDFRIDSQNPWARRLHASQQATGIESRQAIKERRFETAGLNRSAIINRRSLKLLDNTNLWEAARIRVDI
jgi:hypothetical protein